MSRLESQGGEFDLQINGRISKGQGTARNPPKAGVSCVQRTAKGSWNSVKSECRGGVRGGRSMQVTYYLVDHCKDFTFYWVKMGSHWKVVNREDTQSALGVNKRTTPVAILQIKYTGSSEGAWAEELTVKEDGNTSLSCYEKCPMFVKHCALPLVNDTVNSFCLTQGHQAQEMRG